MKILDVRQNSEEWLQFRLGKFGGANAKAVKPLSRGADRTPQGIWQLLAERVADNAGGEAPLERGHRLENVALARLSEYLKQPVNMDCGVWVSDKSDDIYVSPDGSEKSDSPTWAAEVKCLSSARHLQTIYTDLVAKLADDYKPIDSVPSEYQDQVIHYFVVNEKLERLYFVLFDDRIALDGFDFYVIEIERSQIEQLIANQYDSQLAADAMLNQLIAAFAEFGEGSRLPDFGYTKEVKDGQKTA